MSTRASGDFDDENDWRNMALTSTDAFSAKRSLDNAIAFPRPHGVSPACPGSATQEKKAEPQPWAEEMELLAQLVGTVMAHQTAEITRLKKRVSDLEGRERV